MPQQIDIEVQHHAQSTLRAWLRVSVTERDDGAVGHDIDIARAIRATGNGDTLPASHCQVLRSEIAAGVLTAIKQARRHADHGWNLRLERLGGSVDGTVAISALPSIGFAVAATLAVLHGTGVEDLENHPHGGHDWDLARFVATSF